MSKANGLRKITLDGLELLDAIARHGSFSAAADSLGKVTSTISYSVSKLERELEVSLFDRSGTKVGLTDAGRALLLDGRMLLQAVSRLECKVKKVAEGWESDVRLCVDSVVPLEMLEGPLDDFFRQGTSTNVKLLSATLSGVWERLLDGSADVALGMGDAPPEAGVSATEVAHIEFVFCVAPHHPLAREQDPLSADLLRQHRVVVVSDSSAKGSPGATGVISGQQLFAVPDMRSKYSMQLSGLGVGFLPVSYAKPAIDRGLLVAKKVEHQKPRERVFLGHRVGERGRALDWWVRRLGQPGVVQSFVDRASAIWVRQAESRG